MRSVHKILICLLFGLTVLLIFRQAGWAKARWQPTRMPTIEETATVIEQVLATYSGSGVWGWHVPKVRQRWYTDSQLESYAKGIHAALKAADLYRFDYLVTLTEEGLRQSKFLPDAWSKFNIDKATGEYMKFKDPWCDGIATRLGYSGSLDVFVTGTPAHKKRFRRKCDWASRKGGDGGMYQLHMSTLDYVRRMPGFMTAVHRIRGDEEPWHYVFGRDHRISALAMAFWLKKQASEGGCGQWMKKSYSRRQLRHLAKTSPRSTIYSCFKTRFCSGTPMKVGNPKNACRQNAFVRGIFQRVMTGEPDLASNS